MITTSQCCLSLLVFATCLLLVLPSTSAAETEAPKDQPEVLETFQLDEGPLGRTLITVNGSNIITTPNFVVGITLIGISLALLFGSAASAASVAAASTLAAGSFGVPGKFKRSIPESGNGFGHAANIFQAISSVEKQLKNFDVTDVECRKRIICEIHQERASNAKGLGPIADAFLDTFNNLSQEFNTDKYPYLKPYVEAANQGKEQKECSQVYNTCEYSVKNILRNLSF